MHKFTVGILCLICLVFGIMIGRICSHARDFESGYTACSDQRMYRSNGLKIERIAVPLTGRHHD